MKSKSDFLGKEKEHISDILSLSLPSFLQNCCICGIKAETILKLKFIEIFGMAREYVQRINICPNCGFIYTENPFGEEVLANRYKNLSKFEFDGNSVIMEESASYLKRCYRQYNFIKNVIERPISIFEVGCSSGFNLSIYERNGTDVFGIEPSKNNTTSCKRNYGIDLFNGTFDEYKKSSENKKQYELIFLSHVLEHIVDPYSFIFELSKMNSRYIFIEVPTLDYKFCDEPFGMFAEEHVNYFTFDNLRQLMKCFDYRIVDANIYFCSDADIPAGYPCISTLWEKDCAKTYSLTSNMPPIITSRELLMKYIEASIDKDKKINEIIDNIDNNENIAVWGTGHHTSRLLGMTGLKDKNIVKFYDSDTRKDGVRYYGREISKFDPIDIKSGRTKTILISTYVAQNAIENILINHNIGNYIKLY
jgi:hypothetical protein